MADRYPSRATPPAADVENIFEERAATDAESKSDLATTDERFGGRRSRISLLAEIATQSMRMRIGILKSVS